MRQASQSVNNFLLFLFGLGAYPSIKFIGYVSYSEIALLIIGPIILLRNEEQLRRRALRPFLWLIAIWLVSAVFSDLYRGSTLEQYSRGWAKVVMLGLSLVVFYCLLRPNPRAYRYFAAGLVLSSVIVLYYGRVGLIDYEIESGELWESSWETDYVYIILNLGVLLSCVSWEKYPRLTALSLIFLGGLNIAMGSRALGAVLIMSAATVAFLRFSGAAQNMLRERLTLRRIALFAIFAAVAGYVTLEAYGFLSAQGYFGDKSQAKYELQASGRFGLIISGRPNVVGAGLALLDSPVVGYGSWAEDREGYFFQAIELVGFDSGDEAEAQAKYGSRIPTHSYLLEAWVEHGLLAMFFWLYVLLFFVRFVRLSHRIDPSMLALASVTIWLFLWNIFFSPMGARAILGAGLAVILAIYDQVATNSERTGHDSSFGRSLPQGMHRKLTHGQPSLIKS